MLRGIYIWKASRPAIASQPQKHLSGYRSTGISPLPTSGSSRAKCMYVLVHVVLPGVRLSWSRTTILCNQRFLWTLRSATLYEYILVDIKQMASLGFPLACSDISAYCWLNAKITANPFVDQKQGFNYSTLVCHCI